MWDSSRQLFLLVLLAPPCSSFTPVTPFPFHRGLHSQSRCASSSSRSDDSDGGDANNPCAAIQGLTKEEIDALPTIEDLIESGAARREVFKGAEISDRFHWKTRALNGEFGKELGVEGRTDNEYLVDGLQTALISRWPANMSVTVVSERDAGASFVEDVRRSIAEETARPLEALAAERGEKGAAAIDDSAEGAGDDHIELAVKERKNGILSITASYSAAGANIPSVVRERLKELPGAKMVF